MAVGNSTANHPNRQQEMIKMDPTLTANGDYKGPLWSGHRTFLSINHQEEQRNGKIVDDEGDSVISAQCHCWVLSVLYSAFFAAACNSLIGPFLPKWTRDHGLTSSERGVIIASHKAGMAFGALIGHFLIGRLNPGCLFRTGTLFSGLAFAGFGGLWYALESDKSTFYGAACGILAVAGFGFAFLYISALSILLVHYSERFKLFVSSFELVMGIGGVIGVTAGYELLKEYEPCPFFVFGGCLAFGLIIGFAFQPEKDIMRSLKLLQKAGSTWSLLCSISLWIDILTCAQVYISLAHIENVLEEHLRTITLDLRDIGGTFALLYATYCIGMILFGMIGLIWEIEGVIAVFAQIVAAIAFLFIGPASIMPSYLHRDLWLTRLGVCLVGISMSGQLIPVVKHSLKNAWSRDYPRSIWTIGTIVSATMVTVYICGLGSSLLTGYVVERNGHQYMSSIMVFINAAWALIRILAFFIENVLLRQADKTN